MHTPQPIPLPPPGPMLETLMAQADNRGACLALATAADLLEVMAQAMEANATTQATGGPRQLASAHARRDATLYRRVGALLRQSAAHPQCWYDMLITAFDGRFVEEGLTR